MKPCLIIFDIDETLYLNKENKIPESAVLALTKLKHAGHTLAIATGRAAFDISAEVRSLPFDFFIASNGQYVFYEDDDKDKVVYEKSLDPELVKAVAEEACEQDIIVGFVSAKRSTISRANEKICRTFAAYGLTEPQVDASIIDEEPLYQMWIFSEEYEELASKFKGQIHFIPWARSGADIATPGTSKAYGLEKAYEAFPDLPKTVIFFGDGPNDIELIEDSDIGVAMGNGVHEVRQKADFVTLRVDEDGIYYACEHLGLFEIEPDIENSEAREQAQLLEGKIAKNPQDLDNYFKLKSIYSTYLKAPEQAIEVLERALEFHNEDVVLLIEIASVYEFEIEDYEQAKKYYEKVLVIQPDHRLALDALDVLNDHILKFDE